MLLFYLCYGVFDCMCVCAAVLSLHVAHGLTSCGSWALEHVGSNSCDVWALVAPRHAESSQNRDRTHVPGTGRQIAVHCATRGLTKIHVIRIL